MKRNEKIFVAGASGMVGSALVRNLLSSGYSDLVGSYHSHPPDATAFSASDGDAALSGAVRTVRLDLTDQAAVKAFFENESPAHVFLAAAKVGGINANRTYPAQFIRDNLVIQNNIIHAAYQTGVNRLLFLGSSCIYPKLAPQPMKETELLTGPLEPTNEPYAIAKIAGIKLCESYNRQYGTRFMAVMPTNLYGPNDNFDLETSHVLPALLRKFHDAKTKGHDRVTVWGTGKPRREFMHVDDMADACLHLLEHYDGPSQVNVGTGTDVTIKEIAETIAQVTGYEGATEWDTSKPDGTPQKLLDVSLLTSLGWTAQISLEEGLRRTHQWYLDNIEDLRG